MERASRLDAGLEGLPMSAAGANVHDDPFP
jgi:hypothetical protein